MIYSLNSLKGSDRGFYCRVWGLGSKLLKGGFDKGASRGPAKPRKCKGGNKGHASHVILSFRVFPSVYRKVSKVVVLLWRTDPKP